MYSLNSFIYNRLVLMTNQNPLVWNKAHYSMSFHTSGTCAIILGYTRTVGKSTLHGTYMTIMITVSWTDMPILVILLFYLILFQSHNLAKFFFCFQIFQNIWTIVRPLCFWKPFPMHIVEIVIWYSLSVWASIYTFTKSTYMLVSKKRSMYKFSCKIIKLA